MLHRTHNPFTKSALVAALAAATLGLSACADETAGPETGTDVEDIQDDPSVEAGYTGPFDANFSAEVKNLDGQEVTVSADVNEILDESSLTIAGDDSGVEPLLVVDASGVASLEEGSLVQVTDTVRDSFDLVTVEEDLGLDLDDPLYADWESEPYIEASTIDTSVDSE